MRHKEIIIIGNIATGKSSLLELLAKNLPAHPVYADELYKTNPFFQDALLDRKRWSLTSDLWFLTQRIQMTRAYQRKLSGSSMVVDSGVLMSFVYASSRRSTQTMTEVEWQLYNNLYDVLTADLAAPDLVISLNAPVPLLLERIKRRGREFEIKNHSAEYLESLSKGQELLKEHLRSKKIPVLEVDAENTQLLSSPAIVDRVWARLAKGAK